MGRPVVAAAYGRPVTYADIGEPVTFAQNGFGEPVRVVNEGGYPVTIEDGEPFSLGPALLAWWDSSFGVTVTGSGVSSWIDRKSGYDMSQTTDSARPTYSLTSFNGVPGLSFDGTDDRLTLASQPFPSGSDAVEIWAVVSQDRLPAVTTVGNIFAYGGNAGNVSRALQRYVDTGVNRFRVATGNGTSTQLANAAGVDFSGRHLVRGRVDAADLYASIDGGDEVTASTVPATGTTRARIGANTSDTASNFLLGKVRDVIVTTALPSGQASALETFLLGRREL